MSEDRPQEEREDRSKLVAGCMSVAILAVMGGVHVFMKYGGVNPISMPADRTQKTPPRPGSDRSCTVTSKPRGATILELAEDGPVALGVTPTEIEQGDYRIRLELEHHQSVEASVGIHEAECTIHHDLALAEETP